MFDKAIKVILKHEGGYVNHPSDPGGETNYGISKRAYPSLDIDKLSEHDAKVIYKEDYWDKIRGDDLPEGLSLVVFDMAVNAGIKRAIKLLQGILRVKKDGIIGPKTLGSIEGRDIKELIYLYSIERITYYTSLSTFNVFGKGWIKRVIGTLEEAL